MADSGTVDVEAVKAIKEPREFLLNACKAGSSKNVAMPIELVKRALGSAAKDFLDGCSGNSTQYTQANRKKLVKALDGAPATTSK